MVKAGGREAGVRSALASAPPNVVCIVVGSVVIAAGSWPHYCLASMYQVCQHFLFWRTSVSWI